MVPLALLPGPISALLAPVLHLLTPDAVTTPLAYAPLPLLALAAIVALLTGYALRRLGVRGSREARTWSGGFTAPPAWVPFGDPLTQPSATGFAQPVARAIASGVLARGGADPGEAYLLVPLSRLHTIFTRLAERVRRATIRERLAFVFLALVMFLLALGLGEGG
jgi:hypothetical protein